MIPAAEIIAAFADLDAHELAAELERALCERNLYEFLRASWPAIDPSPFCDGWHLEAMAEHLEAVTDGEIKRLLINISPRSGKTNLVTVAWPCWTWAQPAVRDNPLIGPGVRFLCGSYGAKKAQEDGVTARRLIGSDWYREKWGSRVQIATDRDNQERYDTTAGGSRINTGIPESLGKGGMIRILDDPHKTDEVEGEVTREAVLRAYREIWSTRSNDPQRGAEVIVMQRQAENDLSGYVLDTSGSEWVHLCIPARWEEARRTVTALGWSDPREVEGESYWPERLPDEALLRIESRVGPYAWAGQFQQIPSPRGGGIVQADWWRLWRPRDYPELGTVVAALDTAMDEHTKADYNACTIWGAFAGDDGSPQLLLLDAWRMRGKLPDVTKQLAATCDRWKVDAVLIEKASRGLDVYNEIRRMHAGAAWNTILVTPTKSKINRLSSVAQLFSGDKRHDPERGIDVYSGGVIWAPDREWADDVIREVESFPGGAHDDYCDTVSMALSWLRRTGFVLRRVEHAAREEDAARFRRPERVPYTEGLVRDE